MDFISQFIEEMSSKGLSPASTSEIIADDRPRRYTVSGDKPRSKNGSYQLKIEPDFAVGWFRSFKEGKTYKWNSKATREYSAEERAEFKRRVDNEKKRKERELKKQYDEAAARAKEIWKASKPDGSTAYLVRKQAELNGARIRNKLVVVPCYTFGSTMSTLQFIAEDGSKKFIQNSQIAGSYFPMATKDEDKSIMVVCEGFATGDSIRKATGLPVVVAFNSNNLKPVTEGLAKKYPESRFIIAADNDTFTFRNGKKPAGANPALMSGMAEEWEIWREKDWMYNPGIEAARKAAIAIGGASVIWPVFQNNEKKYTDFNDAFLSLGSEYVKDRILAAVPRAQSEYGVGGPESLTSESHPAHSTPDMENWVHELPPMEAYEDEARQLVDLYKNANDDKKDSSWREQLHYNDKGNLSAKSLNNARLFLENDRVLSTLFCYDDFAKEKLVYQCPPWEDPAKFRPRAINDTDYTFLACELEKRGIIQQPGTVLKIVSAVIKNRARNPAKEYLERIKWDGKPRLDNWLIYYCGAEFDKPEYVRMAGAKWLTAAVARVYEPGTKFDHMIILEGPQSAGKSFLLKELATIHSVAYFDDTIKVTDLGNPSTVPKLQGVLIVEIAEMAALGKKDINELKAEITITHDRIVRKYENEATKYPRQFVFAGTINPIEGYLDDPTGNRRFWPVRVGQKIDLESIKRDKEQLWAEAVARYKAGEKLFIDEHLYDMAMSAQRERNIMHPWLPDVEWLTRSRDKIPIKEIWEALGFSDKTKRTRFASNDISKIMVELGFEKGRNRVDGKPEYVWVRKKSQKDLDLEFANDEELKLD